MEPSPRSLLSRERIAMRCFLALSPRLPRVEPEPPPPELAPAEVVRLPRSAGEGDLAATWYPVTGACRGAVLLLPPWVPWGRTYFHRRGRIEALRAAGLAALALDFPGFGGSGPPAGLYDRDVEDGLAALAGRAGRLPSAVWGVSAGGYWAHPALARRDDVAAAFFEDVSPHLAEWSARARPHVRPLFVLFRALFPVVHRFLDMRQHAERFRVRRAAYVAGAADHTVPPVDTRDLAARAGGRHLIVPGAGHLEAIKSAPAEVIGLALETLAPGRR